MCDLRERTSSFHAALFSVGDLAVKKLVMAACCLELSGLLLLLLGGGVRCNEGEWGVLLDNSETCVSKEGESVIVLGIFGSSLTTATATACCCLGEDGMSGGVDGRIGVVVVLLCGGDRLSNGRTLAAAAAVEDFKIDASFILVVSVNLKEMMLGDGGVDGKLL